MMLNEAEIVIIGGGVHGASAAYHLTRSGKQVLLLEKESIGSGGSGQSGGIIRCHYSNEAMVRVAHRSAQRWPGLAAELGHPVDFVQNGLIFAVTGPDAPVLRRLVAMQQRVGVDTAVIEVSEIPALVPEFRTEGLTLAAYERQSGYADPASTAVAFSRKARELGATVLTDTPVTGVEMDGNRVTAVVTAKGRVKAGLVINCAGAWAPRIARMVGYELPVRPGVIEMVAFHPHFAGWHKLSPTWVDMTTMTYCRPDGTGYMLAGGGLAENAELEAADVDPDSYPSRPPLLFTAQMAENLALRCPWAQDVRQSRSWTGPDGNTPDFHFIFGEVPGIQGYFQIVGGSGNSFKLSPATGEAVAEYLTTGKTTYLDMHAFSITRFAESRLLRGSYQMHIVG